MYHFAPVSPTHSNIFRSLQKILVTAACLILGARAAVTWLNSLDGPLHYQCPAHQSIKHVFSVHNNHAEDRQFSLSCADVPVDFSSVTENCYWIASKAIQISNVKISLLWLEKLRGVTAIENVKICLQVNKLTISELQTAFLYYKKLQEV